MKSCDASKTVSVLDSFTEDGLKSAKQFDRSVWIGSANRRYFITDQNHVGIGPPRMQWGDFASKSFGQPTCICNAEGR